MRTLRLLGLVCLIALAVIGVGISGGVPLSLLKNRRDTEKEKTELVENEDQESETKQNQYK